MTRKQERLWNVRRLAADVLGDNWNQSFDSVVATCTQVFGRVSFHESDKIKQIWKLARVTRHEFDPNKAVRPEL